jgi:hypothetical protein
VIEVTAVVTFTPGRCSTLKSVPADILLYFLLVVGADILVAAVFLVAVSPRLSGGSANSASTVLLYAFINLAQCLSHRLTSLCWERGSPRKQLPNTWTDISHRLSEQAPEGALALRLIKYSDQSLESVPGLSRGCARAFKTRPSFNQRP